MSEKKRILLVCRRGAYGQSLSRAALDVALAAAAFEQHVTLLFMGDGVWQLLPEQDPAGIGLKNLNATLRSMPLYDIEQFYVDEEALTSRGIALNELEGQCTALSSQQMAEFIDAHDQVLSF